VEAADTSPFFHNNTVKTLEEAITFYTSDAFANSPSGTPAIVLSPEDIKKIAAFLRVINALENVRNSVTLGRRAKDSLLASSKEGGKGFLRTSQAQQIKPNIGRLLKTSKAELEDAIEVLKAGSLHRDARTHLEAAKVFIQSASLSNDLSRKLRLIGQAIEAQLNAQKHMCTTPAAVLCEG
jgi:hypothetical protein